MSKTPVTILQEYCARRHIVPQYELVVNGVGTHDPIFQYRLTIDDIDIVTYGLGKSKKEAKHEAAKEAISGLDFQNNQGVDCFVNTDQEDIASPYQGAIKQNNVGKLATICVENSLPEPQYLLVGEVGPPHEKLFTFECSVGKLKETGCSRTKQQAKHYSADKMVNRIKDVLGILITDAPLPATNVDELDKKGKEYYIHLKSKAKKVSENFDLAICDYHKIELATACNLDEEHLEYLISYSKIDTPDAVYLLEKIFETSNQTISYYFLSSTDEISLCFCEMEPFPYFVAFGSGFDETESRLQAAHNMLNYIKIYTK